MKITIYTAPLCGYCKTLKKYLTENKISFEEIDVSQNANLTAKLISETDQTSIPIIDIDGKFIVGFNKQEIEKELNL